MSDCTQEVQPLDIVIAIKRDNKQFLVKDLAYCTHDEVIEWLHWSWPTFPFDLIKENDFDSRLAKAQVFDQLLKYTAYPIFPALNEDAKKMITKQEK